MLAIYFTMPSTVSKTAADNLFDSHEPNQIALTLLRIRAYLLSAEHSEEPGGYLEEMQALDLLFLDLCAYFCSLNGEVEK